MLIQFSTDLLKYAPPYHQRRRLLNCLLTTDWMVPFLLYLSDHKEKREKMRHHMTEINLSHTKKLQNNLTGLRKNHKIDLQIECYSLLLMWGHPIPLRKLSEPSRDFIIHPCCRHFNLSNKKEHHTMKFSEHTQYKRSGLSFYKFSVSTSHIVFSGNGLVVVSSSCDCIKWLTGGQCNTASHLCIYSITVWYQTTFLPSSLQLHYTDAHLDAPIYHFGALVCQKLLLVLFFCQLETPLRIYLEQKLCCNSSAKIQICWLFNKLVNHWTIVVCDFKETDE